MGSATPKPPRVLVLHGPNLNLLGDREPDIYGRMTLAELDDSLVCLGRELGLDVRCAQANGEGALIDLVHEARLECAAIIVNPGGYTHSSVALADALRGVQIPAIEVHLSNLYRREAVRRQSLTAEACEGVVMGFGAGSYHLALRQVAAMVGSGPAPQRPSRPPPSNRAPAARTDNASE